VSILTQERERSLIEEGQRARRVVAAYARENFDHFVPFIMRVDDAGQRVRQGSVHKMWTEIRRRHRQAVIEAGPELGKTVQLSVALPIWLLGRDPKLKIALVSAAQGQATKATTAIAQHIERNPRVRMVFPDLLPGDKWTESRMIVKRPVLPDNHPSIQALGVGSAITGSRIDYAILDDVLDRDNTRTKAQRDDVEEWFWSKVMTRMSKSGRVYILSNTWDQDDLIHRLAKRGWPHFRCPLVVDQQLAVVSTRYTPRTPLVTGGSVWPERWPQSRIDDVRRKTPPVEFARSRLCVPASLAESRFKQEWFQAARDRGRVFGFHRFARKLNDVVPVLPPDWRVWGGADLATSRKGKDVSSIAVVLGSADGDRYLLSLQSGKWTADEFARRLVADHLAFGCPFAVESVGMQDLFVELLQRHTSVPIEPFETRGDNKYHPVHGVESWAAELNNGQWTLPAERSDESDALEGEALAYNPARHTGDRMMALWFARSKLNVALQQTLADADALSGFAAGLMGTAGRTG
jgi:hypothetical protein